MTPPTDPAASTDYSNLKFDKEFSLAVAPSRMSAKWANKKTTISEFSYKLSQTIRTHETFDEFLAMPKGTQDEIKDCGGYVAALLKGGRRDKGSVANRQLLTFDVDYGTPKTVERIKKVLGEVAFTLASTHKHSEKKPRFRLIVYPDRVMSCDEHEAVARKVAEGVDIEVFDEGSFQNNRLLFWSSTSSDGPFFYYHNDKPLLSVDKVLGRYGSDGDGWKDTWSWPRSSRETKSFDRLLKKQADPLLKKGLIGAFCRTVPLITALDDYLGDIYKKEKEGRYSYVDGTSTGGLLVYDDKFAYSHHASDPCSNQCLNAFDLIRLHKFGYLDDKVKPDTLTSKLPSYKEMVEWARGIEAVKAELIKSKIDIDVGDFDDFDNFEDVEKDNSNWKTKLQTRENGDTKPTYVNAVHIISHEPELAEIMRFNEFSQSLERVDTEKKVLDWGDADSLRVRQYVDRKYGTDFPAQKMADAINTVGYKNTYHPVRDYLNGLTWDGLERVETMFIDYLGADDNIYTREVAMCVCTAAVSRIFEPGFKFDFAVTLVGGQGIGKTTFIRELGLRKWYGELLSFENQKAMEQIAGKWIVEITELSATNKNELEQQKSFLSAQNTRVRMSYGRYPINFLRQQVFFGSTNREEFLKDSTGNRRWLPIKCEVKLLDYEKLKNEVDQIWAEAYEVFYAQGRTVYLSEVAQVIAFGEQEDRRESDPWEGVISTWLDTDAYIDRYDTMMGSMEGQTSPRDRVCIAEVWEDCLGMNRQQQTKQPDRMRIAAILDRQQEKWRRNKWKKSFGTRFGQQKSWENIEIAKQKVPF